MRARDFPYLDAPLPIALAHRGGAGYGPNLGIENTLAAFQAAVDLGYRYLETDVHATADGVLLAAHDDRLDRVADRTGAIAELPYAAVREALIGGREPIPTLAQMLQTFPEARVNIDVKAAGAIAPLIQVIREFQAVDRVCVGSFSRSRLRAVRQALGPRLCTAAGQVGTAWTRFAPTLINRLLASPAPVLQVPEAHAVAGVQVRIVTPGLVRRVHALGKHIHVWTIDERPDMERLLDWGVDGIVTDRLDTLAEVLADRGHPLLPTDGTAPHLRAAE